jgi:cytochrome c oxidase cbb3-type subunit III
MMDAFLRNGAQERGAAGARPCALALPRSRAHALLIVAFLAGCDANLPGKPNPKDRPISPEKVLAFDALFGRNCAGCHGKDGKLGPAPPLNDPLFRAIVPAKALQEVLEKGRPGTAMAVFAHKNGGTLTAAQIQVLVHEIKGIPYRIVEEHADDKLKIVVVADEKGETPKWGPVKPAPASTPPYAQPAGSGNAENGAMLFAEACFGCHGINGAGVERDGKLQKKINDPAFLALISDQALRRIIITGRPDLGMPDYSQKTNRSKSFQPLSSTDIADLVALLASWRK